MSLYTFLRTCGGFGIKFARAISDSDATAYSLLGYQSQVVGEIVISSGNNVTSVGLASNMRFGEAKPVIDLCRTYGIVVDVK